MSNGACGAPLTIGGIAHLVCFMVFGFAHFRVDAADDGIFVWIELYDFLNWDFSFLIWFYFCACSEIFIFYFFWYWK